MKHFDAGRSARGFSLIELMVALLLSLMLGGAVIAMMLTQTSVSRTQSGMRRVTENARFAMETIAADIRNAAHQSCMNYSSGIGEFAPNAVVRVDRVQSMQMRFDASAMPYSLGEPGNSSAYFVDPAEFVLGSECNGATCRPLPTKFRPVANQPLPTIGTVAERRAAGADVLSLRYLAGRGMPIANVQYTRQDSQPVELQLAPGAQPRASLKAAVIADCGTAIAAQVSQHGGGLLQFAGNFENDTAPMFDARQTRVYDMETDLVSVSYYLKLRNHLPANGQPQRLLSTLVRRENGNDVEIAPGVERLDFLFHVERSDGTTAVLPASEVGQDPSCRSAELPTTSAASSACGWRSLKGVEVFLLVNSVDDAVPTDTGKDATNDTFRYAWLNDGTPNTDDVFETSSSISRLPNGLPPGRLLRKGFRTFVALRGYNH